MSDESESVYIAPHTNDVEGFCKWLSKRWRQAYKDRRSDWGAAKSNYASTIGSTCLRQLYYARVGAERKQKRPETMAVFERGNVLEAETVNFLRTECGVDWAMSQMSAPKDILNIGMKIDGGMRGAQHRRDAYIIGEIKSMNSREFARITDGDVQGIHDMLSGAHWIRKYPYQGVSYLRYFQEPGVIFILRDPSTWAMKAVPLLNGSPIYHKLWAEIEAKAKAVNAAVETEEAPDRIVYSKSICQMCDFVDTACFPERENEGLEILSHPSLIAAATELFELEEAVKKATERKAWLREIILQTGKKHVVIGDVAEAKVTQTGDSKMVRITPLNTGGSLFFGDDNE